MRLYRDSRGDERMTFRWPDDWHVHLRQDQLLSDIARYTSRFFARALVMPNLVPPIRTGSEAVAYKKCIMKAVKGAAFEPLMTIKLLDATTPRMAVEAKALGVIAAKLYPRGATTNAEDGVSNIFKLFPVLAAMEECGLVLCIHAEDPSQFCMDREKACISVIREIVRTFPRLRVVVEHVTSAEMVEAVCELPDTVAATITAHHLLLTLDDVVGGNINPHAFCKPIAKRPRDRDQLAWAAKYGGSKFFFGSDSAPHPRGKKECASGCAGIFSAPVALPWLAQWFEKEAALEQLEPFVSEHGARFYDLPLNQDEITLIRQPWQAPVLTGDVIPFCAGQMMEWDLAV